MEKLNGSDVNGKQLEIREVEIKKYNDQFSKMPCYAFKKGACKFGSSCRFSHDIAMDENINPEQEHQLEVPTNDSIQDSTNNIIASAEGGKN